MRQVSALHSNEVAMRRGIPMAGNFLQQENVVLTGACEARLS